MYRTTAQGTTPTPYVLDRRAGHPLSWFSSGVTLKASTGPLGAVEVVMAPGDEPPMHVHRHEDEWLYVLEGEVTFHVDGRSHRGRPGAFASFPRDIPHTFTVEGPGARLLVINAPGGFERMFEANPQTPEQAAAALEAFGMEIVGPNPGRM
jgi:quercetin dioxygenase-like cupin family protein